jgi:ABC-2 type transport system ATP-binding protein
VSQPAVVVEDLEKRYGGVTALAGLSLAAPTAAVTAVLGPNGAGKTTTVEICAGLRRADSGHVRVLGRDPSRDADALRICVGVMPQTGGSGAAGIYPAVRPREALRLFAKLYANPLDPDALLERLDLTGAADTPWRRLSGGQQQRLSLALAIVGRPTLVFLDEPTAGLDVHGKHATWALVDDLRAAGVTVVLTTHAMDDAEHLADHVVIVDHGRAVAAGTPQELTGGGTRSLEDVFVTLTVPSRAS